MKKSKISKKEVNKSDEIKDHSIKHNLDTNLKCSLCNKIGAVHISQGIHKSHIAASTHDRTISFKRNFKINANICDDCVVKKSHTNQIITLVFFIILTVCSLLLFPGLLIKEKTTTLYLFFGISTCLSIITCLILLTKGYESSPYSLLEKVQYQRLNKDLCEICGADANTTITYPYYDMDTSLKNQIGTRIAGYRCGQHPSSYSYPYSNMDGIFDFDSNKNRLVEIFGEELIRVRTKK
jgi:hypothetical protein